MNIEKTKQAAKAILASLFFVLLMIFATLIATAISKIIGMNETETEILSQLSVIAAAVITVVVRKHRIPERLYVKKLSVKYIIIIIPMTVAITFMVQSVQFLLPSWFEAVNDVEILTGNLFLDVLSLVILGPIAEEMIFRGLILGRLKDNMHVAWSVIIQGLLFGLMHPSSPGWVLMAFLISIYYGILFLKTKSLIAPLLAHMTSNAMSVIFYLILKEV